ncbi:MFS general substrate transporter [Pleurostoma richardsiae]|uniref:MFS general substrate transporter n=1 Tax=Pleurostoma richardsiae TaxID=41990 RepID=A0AA38VM36_9PEZI|nr:MFS general substrate transporter [Pleurostoma richardsiae]
MTDVEKTANDAQDGVRPVDADEGETLEKNAIKINDEAGEYAIQALAIGEAEPAVAKKVLRKIDLYLLPLLCVTFGLQFIDKLTLSVSSVFGIITDNHLVGQQFSWTSSIFFFGFLFAEYPGVALMQRFPIAKFLGGNIAFWGIMLMITASCSSFGGLATCRFFLGAFEATIAPGFVTLTSTWYTQQEQASRASLWVATLGIFSTINGIVTFGIGHISGSLSPWKYIFLILGAITFLWGLVFLYIVPDNPATARWLSDDEKVTALQRVVNNKAGTKTRVIERSQILEAFTDIKIWLIALIAFCNAFCGGALTFQSLIMKGFGFTSLQVALLNMPYGIFQAGFGLIAGYIVHKVPNSRLVVMSAAQIPPIIGTVLINQLDERNSWGRLVGIWLISSFSVGYQINLGIMASNIAGSTKRTFASGLIFVIYCAGQISGPQTFKSYEAPGYRHGVIAMLITFSLHCTLPLVLRVVYAMENKKREEVLNGKSDAEIESLNRECNIKAFEGASEGQNPMFRYAL